jgi:Family of unknown function (DUF6599)
MTAKRLACCIALLILPALAWAEKPNVIPLATSSKWLLESTQKLPASAIHDWGGDPAVEKEYGVESLALRTYTLYPENDTVKVLMEQASDASAAYGLFTIYRTDSMTPFKDLPFTEVGEGSAVMARGQTFIRIVAPTAASSAARASSGSAAFASPKFDFTLSQLQTLLVQVGGANTPSADAQGLPGALPGAGLIGDSEKYLLGPESAKRVLPGFRTDLIGFAQGAEARLGVYRQAGAKVRVLEITYPTPQMARQRFEAMGNLLGLNKEQGASTIYGKLTGSFVILVMDAGSQRVATNLLDQFKATGYITWNQRYQGDQPMVLQVVRLVLANLFLSFILAGFGLFGGVLFFGSKFLARKWFPKSLWGQPDEAIIIRLNLR